jgi:hypothetical protein
MEPRYERLTKINYNVVYYDNIEKIFITEEDYIKTIIYPRIEKFFLNKSILHYLDGYWLDSFLFYTNYIFIEDIKNIEINYNEYYQSRSGNNTYYNITLSDGNNKTTIDVKYEDDTLEINYREDIDFPNKEDIYYTKKSIAEIEKNKKILTKMLDELAGVDSNDKIYKINLPQ